MPDSTQTIRGVLTAMGFGPDRVEAAVAALEGNKGGHRHDEALLTPKQLQERLGISATTLWRMDDLPYVVVGARRRYEWSAIQQFLAERRGDNKGN